jgi:hypothetical protein
VSLGVGSPLDSARERGRELALATRRRHRRAEFGLAALPEHRLDERSGSGFVEPSNGRKIDPLPAIVAADS